MWPVATFKAGSTYSIMVTITLTKVKSGKHDSGIGSSSLSLWDIGWSLWNWHISLFDFLAEVQIWRIDNHLLCPSFPTYIPVFNYRHPHAHDGSFCPIFAFFFLPALNKPQLRCSWFSGERIVFFDCAQGVAQLGVPHKWMVYRETPMTMDDLWAFFHRVWMTESHSITNVATITHPEEPPAYRQQPVSQLKLRSGQDSKIQFYRFPMPTTPASTSKMGNLTQIWIELEWTIAALSCKHCSISLEHCLTRTIG